MELCPKCKRMTAERSLYTNRIICYNRFCEEQSSGLTKSEKQHKDLNVAKNTVTGNVRSR
jgi:hypothetical protein